jgi:hypothetical protein
MAFLIRLNREDHLLSKFNSFIYSLPQDEQIGFEQFEKHLFKKFDKKLWKDNSEDIAYLLETHHCATVGIKKGKIDKIKIKKVTDWKCEDINRRILSYWTAINIGASEAIDKQIKSK